MTTHIETRQRLREISSVREFRELLDNCVLSEKERTVIEMHYLKGYDLGYIADDMGYSISCIKQIHKRALVRLSYLLDNH